MIHRLEELDPAGIEARLAEKPALVLALGTIEWHSHHLPLGLDLLKASVIAERTAERSGAVLAPPAWWAAGGVSFPYTLRLPGTLTEPVLAAVLDGFAEMGFRAGATVVPLADYELLTDLGAAGDHAGVWETSLLMPVRPDLVRLDIEGELPGVIGDDPRGRATRELGEQGLGLASERAAAALDRALTEPREPLPRRCEPVSRPWSASGSSGTSFRATRFRRSRHPPGSAIWNGCGTATGRARVCGGEAGRSGGLSANRCPGSLFDLGV